MWTALFGTRRRCVARRGRPRCAGGSFAVDRKNSRFHARARFLQFTTVVILAEYASRLINDDRASKDPSLHRLARRISSFSAAARLQ